MRYVFALAFVLSVALPLFGEEAHAYMSGASYNKPEKTFALWGDSNSGGMRQILIGAYGARPTGCYRGVGGHTVGAQPVSVIQGWVTDAQAANTGPLDPLQIVEVYGADLIAHCLFETEGEGQHVIGTNEHANLVSDIDALIVDLEEESEVERVIFLEGVGTRSALCSVHDDYTGYDCSDMLDCIDAGYASVAAALSHTDQINVSLSTAGNGGCLLSGNCSVTTGKKCGVDWHCSSKYNPIGCPTCDATGETCDNETACATTNACTPGRCSVTTTQECFSNNQCAAPICTGCQASPPETCNVEASGGNGSCSHDNWFDGVHPSIPGYEVTVDLFDHEITDHFGGERPCP